MIPINYDVVISAICLALGIVTLFRLGVFSSKIYTPTLSALILCAGLMAWAIVTLVSISAITGHPIFLHSEGWQGGWGYTLSRFFMAVMWLLMLLQITFYSPRSASGVAREVEL